MIKLLFTLLLLVIGSNSQAQVLKKLKEKAEQAVEKKVNQTMDKTVEKAVNKTADGVEKAVNKTVDKVTTSKAPNPDAKNSPTQNTATKPIVDNEAFEDYRTEHFLISGIAPQIGDPCAAKEELQAKPGKYFTSDQYPWPLARAEYFKKLSTTSEKATGKQVLNQIENLEQQSRTNFTLAGGNWETYYSTEGYQYAGNVRLADYRFQTAFHEYLCIRNKVERNSEYNTVLRVYVNSLPLNTLDRYLSNAFSDNLGNYAYKDWKNFKAGIASPKIELLNYLSAKNQELIEIINSDKGFWQDVPENEIRKNTYEHVYRYWFVKKADVPLLLPVSRKEYLESLLEYYDREALYLPKSTNYTLQSAAQRLRYFGDLPAILANKKAIVNKVLKENSTEWLTKQAVVNVQEDTYLNQKQNLPEYSSDLTFHKFYDNEKDARSLYKYNPAYFSDIQNTATPKFMSIAFRYVSKPAHLRLINNFTDKFDGNAWLRLIK
ncbi:hypothetical protein [Pedobacter chinensis]|nr:hypothetical protein [Pedobacter chinensis]